VTELDNIPMTDDSEAMEAARKEAEAVETQTKLFHGLKFFLGREVTTSSLCVPVLWDGILGQITGYSSLLFHAIYSFFLMANF